MQQCRDAKRQIAGRKIADEREYAQRMLQAAIVQHRVGKDSAAMASFLSTFPSHASDLGKSSASIRIYFFDGDFL